MTKRARGCLDSIDNKNALLPLRHVCSGHTVLTRDLHDGHFI